MNKQLAIAIHLACLAAGTAGAEEAATSTPSTQQLPKISVQDTEIADASTQGRGYASDTATIGKDVRPLRELPHSVTVVTRDQLTDQNITTIEGAPCRRSRWTPHCLWLPGTTTASNSI